MKTKAAIFTGLLLLAGVTLFAPIYMNYLKIDSVPGDSTAPGYQGWIDASSINFANRAAVTNTIGGSAGPECSIHEIVVTKNVPKNGRKLSESCATGKHFPQATIAIRGERHLLQDVVVKSVQDVPAGDGSVRELITLDYGRCATHESPSAALGFDKRKDGSLTPDLKTKALSPNAILIGLTPRPEAASLIGLLFNGDGRATLTRKAGGQQQDAFRQAFQSKQRIPSLTLTLNNGQKWTFTNVTIAGITDGTSRGTEALSLNFTNVQGPTSGFQDLSYKE